MDEDDILGFTPDPEDIKARSDAKAFLRGLEGAAESGMQIEYVDFVVKDLRRGATMEEAIWFAQCEWDL